MYEESQQIAMQFDKATYEQNADDLKALIEKIEQDVENYDICNRVQLYYSLATAVSDLWSIENPDKQKDNDTIQKTLYYYRKAIESFEDEAFQEYRNDGATISLMASTFINYGNALESCGRIIAAIEQYYFAINIYPRHPMAQGNLGVALLHYSQYLSSTKTYARDCMNYYAVTLLDSAIKSKDKNIYKEAREFFKGALNNLNPDYRKFLQKGITFDKTEKMSKNERLYREWCINAGLFITPFSDLPCNSLSFAFDEMTLPEIITGIDQNMPIEIGMYNQLKQEFVSARYLYYETLTHGSKPHFSDKRTCLTDTLEYAQFSLRIEKLKTSFKTLFGILDKIAYFLNTYFDLGIKQKDVDFKSIWQSKKNGRNGYDYKNTLDTSNNFALLSLKWIQREFEHSEDKYACPKFRRIKDIRNYLEHKYTIVTMFENSIENNHSKEEKVALYISEIELSNHTLMLLKLVREAIICVALCVNVEERNRIAKRGKNFAALQMIVNQFDDEYKI